MFSGFSMPIPLPREATEWEFSSDEEREDISESSDYWTSYPIESLPLSLQKTEESPPVINEKIKEIKQEPLPPIEGQPSQAATDDEYMHRISSYRGETIERISQYVDELLNDPNLNKPSSFTTPGAYSTQSDHPFHFKRSVVPF